MIKKRRNSTTMNKRIRHRFLLIGIICILVLPFSACNFGKATTPEKATEESNDRELLSVKMANSEMQRYPELWRSDHTQEPRWGYHQGLIGKVMLDMWKYTGEEEYFQYVKNYADTIITDEGAIKTYEEEKYNIDLINAGKILFPLYEETGDEKYKAAIETLRDQMRRHPRTTEGGFWHKKRYTHQMWLDGMYMGAPFLAQYAKEFNEPELFDDAVKQIELIAKHTYDPEKGLYYHGWDESKEQVWADEETGTSPNFWGRSLGWFGMALVDLMDHLPENHEGREVVLENIQRLAAGVEKYQDEETGVWYQVVDQGDREGNYLESSASSMLVYFLYKAVREGYLDKSYLEVANDGYEGLVDTFIEKEADSTLSITQCCVVAGLSADRDGSFEYYIDEPIRENDPKAIAPFIWASMEHEKLAEDNLASTAN